MTPTAANWFLAIIGTGASVAGVVFSWMAWVQATKAKDAAEEAAAAVNTRNTALEFSRLAVDAKELLFAVQQKHSDQAISAANNLVHELQIASSRRRNYLPPDPGLQDSLRSLRAVTRLLSTRGLPKNLLDLDRLIGLCLEIHESICKIAGNLDSETEGDGK